MESDQKSNPIRPIFGGVRPRTVKAVSVPNFIKNQDGQTDIQAEKSLSEPIGIIKVGFYSERCIHLHKLNTSGLCRI